MSNLKISKRHIVTLWHETQTGNIHTCNEKQLEGKTFLALQNFRPEIRELNRKDFQNYIESFFIKVFQNFLS